MRGAAPEGKAELLDGPEHQDRHDNSKKGADQPRPRLLGAFSLPGLHPVNPTGIGLQFSLKIKRFSVLMPYIVDGNNVMGQTPGWHRDKAKSRVALLRKLAAFARIKKARVTVVFDGGPDSAFPEGSAFHSVKVLYAKPGSDADSRIVGLVETSTDPRGLTIVTSDQHLGFLVKARGAAVIRSGEFRSRLERLLESMPIPEDGEQFEVGEINSWLRYFGSLPEDDDVD